MRFTLSLPNGLKDVYSQFEKSEKGRQLLELSGIARHQLDSFKFFKDYFTKNVVDISINPNGNVGNQKSNTSLITESSSSLFKLAGFVDMYEYLQKIGVKKEKAKELISDIILGKLYAHDQTKWSTVPYCIAVSTYNLMVEGRPYGQLHSLPPKRPDSFIAQVIEFIMDLSQEFAGAVAVGDLAVNYAYFVNKVKDYTDKQIENDFQKLVHVVNNKFRLGGDSPFTNISFFDAPALESMFSDYKYPDGGSPIENPYFSTINRVQQIWMEFMSKKDPKSGLPYRFPVATVNLTVDKGKRIIDKRFYKLYSELNTEGIFNVYIVDGDSAKLASCCFHPKQKILVKSSSNGIELTEIGEFLEKPAIERRNWTIYHNGSWVKASPVRVPYNRKWYKIVTSNKKEIIVTDDHIHVTLEGDKKTIDLSPKDYLMFSTYSLLSMKDVEFSNFNYFDGFVIGAFLGDGSFGTNKGKISNIRFCLNEEKYKILKPIIDFVAKQIDSDATISTHQTETSVMVIIYSKKFINFITKFVDKKYSCERFPILDSVLRCKHDFRLGLVKGLYLTDGGNSNRIYTTSKEMIDNLEVIFTTLGIPTVIDVFDGRSELVIIHNKKYNRNFKLYCIRFFEYSNTRNFSNLYKIYNNSIFFKIVSIEEIDNHEGTAYCVEMKNKEEPYFTLPNGIITHNCRLTSDITQLMEYKGIDSFGNGGVNIGCYDEKTEILTKEGWKLFKDLDRHDEVLTLDKNTWKVEFQKPTAYFEYEYDGEMHHYKSCCCDLLVTPNHNMFGKSLTTKKVGLILSENFGGGYWIPCKSRGISKRQLGVINIDSVEFSSILLCKLIGIYLACGSIDDFLTFIPVNNKARREIASLLNDLNIQYELEDGNFIIKAVGLVKFFEQFGVSDREKNIPYNFIDKLGKQDIKSIIEGFKVGSNAKFSKDVYVGGWLLPVKTFRLKDDFCYLISLIGRQSSVEIDKKAEDLRYIVRIREEDCVRHISTVKTYTHYKGKIYCVEVPNHIVLVRRGGLTNWCGNSHRVVTINLPRIAIDSKDTLYDTIKQRMEDSALLLVSHRELIKDRIKQGFLKFFHPLHWLDLDRMFYSTIGLIGFYEFCELLGYDLKTDSGKDFLINILQYINDILRELIDKYGVPFNLEQIPGESAAVTLAKKDKLLYKTDYVLYSNQFIPLWEDILVTDRIKIDGLLDEYFGGGVISHLNIGSKLTPVSVRKLTNFAIENGLQHFAFNLVFSNCENGHFSSGKVKKCPICGSSNINYVTRIVGYFVPVQDWVKQRREWEFNRRKWQDFK